jgi:hypothetical protein
MNQTRAEREEKARIFRGGYIKKVDRKYSVV